jgi:alpha-L-arabinofuranosidase
VLAVFAGYSLDGEYVPSGPQLRPYVQDALDELQYATGATNTAWGARRAADGHPAPFTVPYVEIGNEDFYDRSGSYDGRFAQFYDAIKAAHPHVKLIATTSVHSRRPDLYDQHFYMSPRWFSAHTSYYDGYSRRAPKVFVGEYAAQTGAIGQSAPTLGAALGEAAWMTGLERNADVVTMASYAPLFQNVNDSQWSPDLISYDALRSDGSPSYYVQQLFSLNHGDVVVPTSLSGATTLAAVASISRHDGMLYLMAVNTASSAQTARIVVEGAGVASRGTTTVLTSGSPDDQNSLAAPRKVAPVTRPLRRLGPSFAYTFRPYSLTVLRLSTHAS